MIFQFSSHQTPHYYIYMQGAEDTEITAFVMEMNTPPCAHIKAAVMFSVGALRRRQEREEQIKEKMWLKRTSRDTHLHINRGSPYQKQRGQSSQTTSSGTVKMGMRKAEVCIRKHVNGRKKKSRAKSFITVITT